MNNEMNGYICDTTFANEGYEDIGKITKLMFLISKDYEDAINQIEQFFNNQTEEDDLENFKGEVFELSDANSEVHFPFRIKDHKLLFFETEEFRSIMLAALILKRTTERHRHNNKDKNELSSKEFQHYSLQ